MLAFGLYCIWVCSFLVYDIVVEIRRAKGEKTWILVLTLEVRIQESSSGLLNISISQLTCVLNSYTNIRLNYIKLPVFGHF